MPQQAIEVILTRQLARHLSMPAFLVDAAGNVLHYNAPAERVLGDRLEQARAGTVHDLAALFQTRDAEGRPVPTEALPIVVALEERHPAHARLRVLGNRGQDVDVAVTAMPLVGQGSRFLGAIAFFWEVPS